MKNKETLETGAPHHWSDLMTSKDQEQLQAAYKKLFPTLIENGYEVVAEVGVESGRLLQKGPDVHRIQISVAHQEITKLQRRDADETDRALWSNPDWHSGMDHPKPEFEKVYVWHEQALIPPGNWRELGVLSVTDLKLDRSGITIFVKTTRNS